jgi:signal transduction histidine kinase
LSREKRRGETLQVFNELIGRMAHELRNPLVAVRTFTQLMKDRYNDKDFQEFFYTTVTGEVEKLNNLIEKLIAFVHPIEYKFETVDMGELMDKTLESILKDQKTSDLRLIKNYAHGIFKLSADKAQLGKAFSYILQNSLIAMNSGGTLTVNVESLLKDAMIKVSIKDTGRGIPQEDIERAFDPFYTTPEKGIGLGLPLSQKIIEDHKGKVTIESAPNQGTSLTVLLPIAAPTQEEV